MILYWLQCELYSLLGFKKVHGGQQVPVCQKSMSVQKCVNKQQCSSSNSFIRRTFLFWELLCKNSRYKYTFWNFPWHWAEYWGDKRAVTKAKLKWHPSWYVCWMYSHIKTWIVSPPFLSNPNQKWRCRWKRKYPKYWSFPITFPTPFDLQCSRHWAGEA